MFLKRLLTALFIIGCLMISQTAYSQIASDKQSTVKTQNPKKAESKQSTTAKKTSPKKKSSRSRNPIPEVPLSDARVTYDGEIFNFGRVFPGSRVVHNFIVQNTGPDTLRITRIKPT